MCKELEQLQRCLRNQEVPGDAGYITLAIDELIKARILQALHSSPYDDHRFDEEAAAHTELRWNVADE